MGLRLQFNIAVITVLLAAFALAAWASHGLLARSAREDVLGDARLVMEAAAAMGAYTAEHVQPQLVKQMDQVFLPQTVSSFASAEALRALVKSHPGYSYREAALQPTNPRNRAAEWEAELVHRFRGNPELAEVVSQRSEAGARKLLLVRPIKVSDTACLQCHSSPAAAPASMVKKYGQANGFGWRHNEIVGARLVSVPMDAPLAKANAVFVRFMLALGVVFLLLLAAMNLLLEWLVVRPIRGLTVTADKVSAGDLRAAKFAAKGSRELKALAEALDRVRGKLREAVRMLVNN
jgi:methyl-accepting chemotaxis protein